MNIDSQFIEHRKFFREWIFFHCGMKNELADDLTQDLYIKIRHQVAKGNYTERGKFKAWAVWIAKNIIVDYFRKENKAGIYLISDEKFSHLITDGTEFDSNIEDKIIREEQFAWLLEGVTKAIENLDGLQRKVFLMRILENKSFKDIISETGEKQNTEIGRFRYAKINIRKKLKEYKIAI